MSASILQPATSRPGGPTAHAEPSATVLGIVQAVPRRSIFRWNSEQSLLFDP